MGDSREMLKLEGNAGGAEVQVQAPSQPQWHLLS